MKRNKLVLISFHRGQSLSHSKGVILYFIHSCCFALLFLSHPIVCSTKNLELNHPVTLLLDGKLGMNTQWDFFQVQLPQPRAARWDSGHCRSSTPRAHTWSPQAQDTTMKEEDSEDEKGRGGAGTGIFPPEKRRLNGSRIVMTRPCIGSSWEGAVHTPENNGGPVGGGRFWFCAEGTSGPVIIHRWMVPTEDGLPAVR